MWQGTTAGVALAMAALTRPQLLLLLPVGAIWLLADETWRRLVALVPGLPERDILPFVAAVVLLVATTYLLRDPQADATWPEPLSHGPRGVL